MSYIDNERSKHDGKPIELYRYDGTYAVYRYTSGPVPIYFQAPDEDEQFEYLPLATKRSDVVNTTQNDDTAEVTIELPVSSELVAVYGFQVAPPSLYLTIFRGHNPGEYIRYWGGQVENIRVAKGTATIRVPSEFASVLGSDMPNVYYQTPCNHTLGDAQCGVDMEDWSVTTTITAVVGNLVTVTTGSLTPLNGNLVGGDAILPSGERRMITAQTGNSLRINYPFAGASVGQTILIMSGCDLAWKGDCKNRYGNTINHGGYPLIPSVNVFQQGLEPGKGITDESKSCFNPWTLRITVIFTVSGGDMWPWTTNFPQAVTADMMPNGRTRGKDGSIAPGAARAFDRNNVQIPNRPFIMDRALMDYNNPDGSSGGPMYGFRVGNINGLPSTGAYGYEYFFFFPISPDPNDRTFTMLIQRGHGSPRSDLHLMVHDGEGTLLGSNVYTKIPGLWPFDAAVSY